jgi:ADP-ribose pyrophosphatase YjhB (NUDIX family)
MNPELIFLNLHEPLESGETVWDQGGLPLRYSFYISQRLPSLRYVSSVRAILFKDDSIMVIRGLDKRNHILPGGRCEAGESLEITLQRELPEESGWSVRPVSILGFIHFHHLAPRRVDYPFPFPDFVQLAYFARAIARVPRAQIAKEYEPETGFHHLDEIKTLGIELGQWKLLQAALENHR